MGSGPALGSVYRGSGGTRVFLCAPSLSALSLAWGSASLLRDPPRTSGSSSGDSRDSGLLPLDIWGTLRFLERGSNSQRS